MTRLPSLLDQHRQLRWLTIAAAAWMLLISVIAVVSYVGLNHLSDPTIRNDQGAQIRALGARVSELSQQHASTIQQPKPASEAEFTATRRALNERLARVEQMQIDVAHTADVRALEARVTSLEAHQTAAHTTPTAGARPARRHTPAEPKNPELPFRVIGVELRGGERFLSIAAPDATSIAGVRLLREGERDGGWQLRSIEDHAAVFQVNGQIRRITLP